jgi:septin family protein
MDVLKKDFRYLGDFAANYILEHPEIIIDGNNKNWKEIAETILTEFYKEAGREAPPDWVKYFVEEKQLEDSKEDTDLLFRSFLIKLVNETHNKFYRNITKDVIVSIDIPFDKRLEFCLNNKLIPFLNLIDINEKEYIAITSDLITELKQQQISEISSLPEVASIIDGFEYGLKE